MLRTRLFRVPAFAAGLGVQLAFAAGLQGFFLIFTIWVQAGQHFSPLRAGLTAIICIGETEAVVPRMELGLTIDTDGRAHANLFAAIGDGGPTRREALEVTRLHSAAGLLSGGLITVRPFRSPHHTVSTAGCSARNAAIRVAVAQRRAWASAAAGNPRATESARVSSRIPPRITSRSMSWLPSSASSVAM